MAHTTKKMKLKRTMREVLDDEASAMSVEEELMNNVVKSRRPAVLRCLHAIPRCGGAFTPSTRLVSYNHGGGWFLFDF